MTIKPTVSRGRVNMMMARLTVVAMLMAILASGVTPHPSKVLAVDSESNENPCLPNATDQIEDGTPVSSSQDPEPAAALEAPEVGTNADDGQEASSESTEPLIFSDGFESFGDLRLWEGTNSLQPQQGDVASGDWAARGIGTADGGGTFARRELSSNLNDVYYALSFKIVSQGANPVDLLAFRTTADQNLLTVLVNEQGALAYANDFTDLAIASTSMVSLGDWHRLQFRFRIDLESAAIETSSWFDGRVVPEFSSTTPIEAGTLRLFQVDTQQYGGVVNRLELGDSTGGRLYDALFDNILISQTLISSERQPDPLAGEITVQTVPAIRDVVFELDGQQFSTDADGLVTVHVNRWSPDLRRRITSPLRESTSGVFTRFGRWYLWGGVDDTQVQAALDVFYPVTWSFESSQGNEIDASLVTSITFKNSLGVRFTFGPEQHGKRVLLQGSRIVPSQSGLDQKELYFTLESACVSGASVVNRAQQRYFPFETQDWTIELLFYSAQISSHDAFFGFAIGSAIQLKYPDGSLREFPLNDEGELFISALPRGEYEISAVGPGYSPPRPVAVTRDQVVELETVSYVDMASAILFLTLAGFGLLFIGRPELYRRPIRGLRRVVIPHRRGVESAGT